MEAPAITRRRKPFLAPLWVAAFLAAVVVSAAAAWIASAATTTVVLVRHAEKADDSGGDPPLSTAGEARAQSLARLLGSGGDIGTIRAVYVSDTRRTRQTAAPLLARLGQRATVVSGADIDGLVRQLRHDHRGETVLVVGHSNTLPKIIRALTGIDVPPIGEDEYDNVYVVSTPTLGDPSILRLRY